ncbi:alpha/beta fold hydrolase [Humitalea sp. 24SJ18S-53]|uniref:alpha/beta fold hydrolase n=1 Tax=Humitalea sp. 24SJ18S-53 TaxID=3422307 RepID=UPI003D664C64
MTDATALPRQRGFLDRPDCRLYWECMGSGPAIVFAHGLGGNHLSWWQQVAHFAPHYTCVTFSHRGFAPSTAPAGGPDPAAYAGDLAALVAHLDLTDVRIVGQSMGGWTALDTAFAKPAWLRAIVMAATSGTIDPRQAGGDMAGWTQGASDARRAALGAGVHPAIGLRAAREQPALHQLYRAIDELSTGLDKEAVRARLGASRTRPLSDLAAVSVPVLWLTGEEDGTYPSFAVPAMAAATPRGTHIQFEATGHSAYFERAAAFNKIVGDFFSELD